MTSPDITFVIGGARSGKSLYAENLAAASGLPVTYIATAAARNDDPEFTARIAHHRARRPAQWALTEADADLAGALGAAAAANRCVLIDCLTLWLASLLCPADTPPPRAPERYLQEFDAALARAPGKIVVVSNEIGLGVVPLGSVTRHYVDELGRLNQRVAAASTRATMLVAGLPLALKG